MKLNYKDPAKTLHTLFKRGAADVLLGTSCNQTEKSSSGMKFKEALVTFKDGQTLMLRLKQTGDVFQALLNGKVLPVKAQDDDKAAIAEIVAKVKSNSDTYQKSLSAQKIALPSGVKTAAPTMLQTLRARNAQLDAQIAEAKAQLGPQETA